MYAIQGDFRRFCFDRSVVTFGAALEAELDSVEGKTDKSRQVKRARILDRWLERPLRYRNAVATSTASPLPGTGSTSDIEQTYSMSGDGSEESRT